MEKLDYWQKDISPKKYKDLEWNIPEQKTGEITILGGNSQNFSSVIKSAEFLQQKYPVKNLHVFLPDAIKNQLPNLPELIFAPSTGSGSFDKSNILENSLVSSDFNIIIGDLSKNSATSIAVANAVKNAKKEVLLARDSIDVIGPEMINIIEKEGLFLISPMSQLQKLFRTIYYPKVLLLSMPLPQVIETLHKFTLSYKATVLTFHQEKIIIASSGKVATIPIEKTSYTPISLWNYDLACKIAMMNYYNPKMSLEATVSALN